MAMERDTYEDKLNVLLSEVLEERGVLSRGEHLTNGRSDVIVHYQGFRIVLEGSYDRRDAEEDARKRIKQLSIDLAIAIHYPKEFPQNLSTRELKKRLQNASFHMKIISPKDIAELLETRLTRDLGMTTAVREWKKGDLGSLANIIRESAEFIIKEHHIKNVEKDIESFIQDFVANVGAYRRSDVVAENLYDVLLKLYGFSIGDPEEIKEAIFAQAGLALLLSSTYYEAIRHYYNMKSLSSLAKQKGNKPALEQATEDILNENYEPIFKITEAILQALPPLSKVYEDIIELATKIASKQSLLRRDIAGRIYHDIVGSWALKKGLAVFFTQISSSYLLLNLANPELVEKDETVTPPRICDFACGSGTLLTAAYSATRSKYGTYLMEHDSHIDPNQVNTTFHKEFIQNCYAFDVLKYATQIASLNIALHSPETPLEEFNTYTLPLGMRQENGEELVSLGSLEFARSEMKLKEILKGGEKLLE